MFPYNDNLLPIMAKDTQKLFVAGLKNLFEESNREREQESKKKITWSEIADFIDVTSGNLSGFLNYSRNYSEKKRTELAEFFGKSYIEVLDLGRSILSSDRGMTFTIDKSKIVETLLDIQRITNSQTAVINLQDKADKKHAAVIAGFKDKDMAVELNEILVEIEKLEGTTGLADAKKQLNYVLMAAREKKGLAPLQQNLKNGTSNQQS